LLEGSVRYGGKSWSEGTYFYLPNGARSEATHSESGATFFTISLPMIADIAAERAAGAQSGAKALHVA
jgi:hypothetical protein